MVCPFFFFCFFFFFIKTTLSVFLPAVIAGILVACSVTGALGDMSTARKGDFVLYTSILLYCNSLLNPLIYAVKIPAIRTRFRSIFCRCSKEKDETRSIGTEPQTIITSA